MSRLIRMRERGHAVACNGCNGLIDVPESLDFPDYVDLYEDRILAGNVQVASVVSLLMCCAPAAAVGWWLASGAAQRAADEGRPLDPVLVRARHLAGVAAVGEAIVFVVLALSCIRRW
jgi:hypothetical protein